MEIVPITKRASVLVGTFALLVGCGESDSPTTDDALNADPPASEESTSAEPTDPAPDESSDAGSSGISGIDMPDKWPGELTRFVFDGDEPFTEVYEPAGSGEYAAVGECSGPLQVTSYVTYEGERDPEGEQIYCLGSGNDSWNWVRTPFSAGDAVSVEMELSDDTEWAWVAIVPKEHMPDFDE